MTLRFLYVLMEPPAQALFKLSSDLVNQSTSILQYCGPCLMNEIPWRHMRAPETHETHRWIKMAKNQKHHGLFAKISNSYRLVTSDAAIATLANGRKYCSLRKNKKQLN